jgi:hypothetical protein
VVRAPGCSCGVACAPRASSRLGAVSCVGRVTRFVDQLFAALNGSALAVFVSIGHKTGLIKTMMGLTRSTSAQIAEAAGLQERYVREWLSGMVVTGIVEYSAEDGTYDLPREHAVVLTGGAGPNVIAGHPSSPPNRCG